MSRDLILIALSLMTWGLGEGMFYFFQPLYLQQLGANPVRIGGILGMVGLAMTISFLPAGYLSDRFGRRPLIMIAWVMGASATWLMALAKSLPLFVAGMVLYGLTSFVTVPLNSYTTAARGRLSVGRTITLISASYSLGMILGPLLGGWLGSRAGLHANFRIAGFIFIVSTLFILFIRPQPVEPHASVAGRSVLTALKNERYLRYLALIFFITFGMYLPQPLTQNFLQNERSVSLMQIGQLLSARSAGIVVINLVVGQLNARVGLLLAQAFMGLFTILIWAGGGFPAYLLGYSLMGSYMTARAMIIAQGRTLVQAANMGLAYGTIETVASLAMMLGPPLAGILYQTNPEWVFAVSLVLISLGLLANWRWSPVRRKDMLEFEEKEKTEWMPS